MMMKTIEERADEYVDMPCEGDCDKCDILLPNCRFYNDKVSFIAGAQSEHEELTRWHDPKEELPKLFNPNDDYPLLIKDSDGKVWAGFYRASDNSWWLSGITGNFNVDLEFIHWREIHDWLPLKTYKEMDDDESSNIQPATIILDALPHLEWMAENLTGHGGTEVDGRWYYTWDQAMAAAAELGDGWRLPTREEFQALADAGSVWDDERKGHLFGGKLFLEAAGYLHYGTGAVTNVASYGYYWSSSPYSAGNVNAGNVGFNATYVNPLDSNGRAHGFSVRCVREIKR